MLKTIELKTLQCVTNCLIVDKRRKTTIMTEQNIKFVTVVCLVASTTLNVSVLEYWEENYIIN